MWRRHADNDTPEAWRDMVASMQSVVAIAEETGVTVAFEPEVNNVVDSAVRARRLLDEIGSPNLKVVMDGANLFHEGELKRMHEVLDEAFDLLGNDIAIAHAKDLRHDGDAGHEAAGTGMLDYDYYLASLKRCGFDGALIAHGLSEAQVPQCVSFLRDKLSLLQCER
jgi:sugar phosphate isomerase/epimerase